MKNKISKTKCKVSKKNNVLYLRLPETNLPPMEIYKLNKDIIKIVRPRQSRRFVFLHFENEEKAQNAIKDIIKSDILKKPSQEISKKKSSQNLISTSKDGLEIVNKSKPESQLLKDKKTSIKKTKSIIKSMTKVEKSPKKPESKLLINKKSPIKKVKASKKAKTKVEKSLKEPESKLIINKKSPIKKLKTKLEKSPKNLESKQVTNKKIPIKTLKKSKAKVEKSPIK